MRNRYSNTERVGVNATEQIVINELLWIFRDQPIVDVGVDAIVEQSEDGNPTGKFLAVQIKTGASHFNLSKNKLTYYVSNIHYNYWLSLDIPIILVAHLPETKQTCWQHLCKGNFKKTSKGGWKIEIPLNKRLNKKSKSKLTRILSRKNKNSIVVDLYNGKINSESLFDANENIDCMSETRICIENIDEILNRLFSIYIEFSEKVAEINISNLELKIYKLKALIRVFSKKIYIASERLEKEIYLYSILHSTALYACEHVTLFNYSLSKNKSDLWASSSSTRYPLYNCDLITKTTTVVGVLLTTTTTDNCTQPFTTQPNTP
ncbi:MAG: DUF4365 domain-containing protein, partial [Candidatus Electrothrix sp. MAN1_4]|nr:DUF4365 domain-containing protein [Candidatus Electrothrix sp. MAN1_4]